MEKTVLLTEKQITDRLQRVTDKAYVMAVIDEDGYRAYNADDNESAIRNNQPPVSFSWDELSDMLECSFACYCEMYNTAGNVGYGAFDMDVEPRVGDMVVWTDPETHEELDGYKITYVNGEVITIHHENGSEAEVMEHELRMM